MTNEQPADEQPTQAQIDAQAAAAQRAAEIAARVAYQVDTLTRREGDVVTFEVMDKLDPTQRESNIVFVANCTCGLSPEQTDTPFCKCGAAEQAITKTADYRRQYATQIDLTGSVVTGAK